MKLNYEPLSKHIQLVDYRNSGEVTSTVLGISIDKEFMPSVANVIGTDLSRYKLISKGLFACNPMHVGRDERLPIALYEKDIPAIVSPAYFMFEIIDRDVLNEEYFHNFNSTDYFNGSPKEQLACLNRAVEYVQLTEDLETRFMAAVKRMKQAFNLCSSSDAISDREKDYLHFYCAVRSILFKLTKGDAPDISQMNARVRELLEGAIQSDGIEELFETGKHISVDIFSDEYLDKINAIQLPNTKIKVLQRLLSQAIDEYKKVNRIMGMEFSDRLKRVVDEYNNRRRDEAFANEVLDDVAEQLAKLLEELKKEKDSFKGMGIDYEEKAFYDILKAVAKKYEFEYPDDKMIELSKRIKLIVDDKAKYTDWSTRDDIKANLQVDLILLLDEFDYPPVTIDDVYKEVLEQAENFKKYSE